MTTILQALYFMLPAYLANMAPVFVSRIPWGAYPLDHFAMLGGKRLFGAHKTYRGLVAGICGGILTVLIQRALITFPFWKGISLLAYDTFSLGTLLLLGIAFGGGALLGDLLKSFFKRRLNIADGRPFPPFDQIDFLIGALVLTSFFYAPPGTHLIILFIATPLLHFAANVIGHALGLKKEWW